MLVLASPRPSFSRFLPDCGVPVRSFDFRFQFSIARSLSLRQNPYSRRINLNDGVSSLALGILKAFSQYFTLAFGHQKISACCSTMLHLFDPSLAFNTCTFQITYQPRYFYLLERRLNVLVSFAVV